MSAEPRAVDPIIEGAFVGCGRGEAVKARAVLVKKNVVWPHLRRTVVIVY